MDTLISRQLYLQLRFQFPIFLPSQTLYLHIPVSGLRTLSQMEADTFKSKNQILLFFLHSLVIAHPKYDNWLLGMKIVCNLQIHKNITFNRATEEWGLV